MALKDQISELITPALHQAGYFLEDVNIVSPGQHRIVTVIVDSDSHLNLDQITAVTKEISEVIETLEELGDSAFTLEVTSPGIDRPLTLPRHFAKNVDRLLKVTKNDGVVVTGRIRSNTENDVTLEVAEKKEVKEVTVALADIKRATVEIEFNRKNGDKE